MTVLIAVAATLFIVLFGVVGAVVGWLSCERYLTFHMQEPHEYEDLFENNPHPELFDAEGQLDRGQYYVINFPPDFDPDTDKFYIDDSGEDESY